MRPLSPVDILFLALEKRQQPMHVGGLFLFRLPKQAGEDFVYNLVQDMRMSNAFPAFPFNQVLENLVFWDKDEDFDIDHHFRHIALPRPGRVRELLIYVSQEHSALLDRAKPLWECHIIEGIEDNRFALYFKIHHSLVDGIAAMRLIQKSLSKTPNERFPTPIWALAQTKRHISETLIKQESSKPHKVNKLRSFTPVAKELLTGLKELRNPEFTTINQAPPSIFNNKITGSRRISAQSYAFARFKRIAQCFNVTLNDAVLAICAGALRHYLLNMNALPKKPLIAFVPISLRSDQSSSGNQISFLLANLATHLQDPVDRLFMIHRSMKNGKERFGRMNQAQVISYSAIVYSLIGVNLLGGFMPKHQGFNLIISNVPGSREPLYWNGAQLEALYPASIVLDGQAMNITLASYLDKIEFGITACNRVLPRTQTLLQLLEDELCLFDTLCDEVEAGIR